jgi:hypothetical protein
MRLIWAIKSQRAGTCQSYLLLLCADDFEVRVVIEGYRLLRGEIVGHGSKLLACVSSARATDMLAIPATATARTIADTFAFFIGGSLSVAAAV